MFFSSLLDGLIGFIVLLVPEFVVCFVLVCLFLLF